MNSMAPLSVRVTPGERELLEAAAGQARTSLSEFIRRKAIEAAELELMEPRSITIPAEKWEEFEAWVRSPPQDLPKLRKLMVSKPVWED
ncbi:DUF1778 domain-containing protein [Mesorhizobium sp. IMUNJ 23232]|uniref:DUF1778 domain-containing protein n=1 Tax=Mesorhizobium sp. IMUNJ 23232 TaxID=3376064 RepID=UPI00378B3673